ncbi:MAG: tetratricopeptide repeat protein, partial [Armatimonadetes bacterium]|nr:tetratricopeptide repeat protein [Armatimonadota bacterium]
AAPESPILHLLLGDMYQYAENLPDADASYRKAISLAPGWAKPRTNLGLLKLAQNKPAQAVRLFESALANDPQNTELLFFRADAQRESGDLTGAIATYRRIETRAVNRKTPAVAAQALTGLGQAYAAGGRMSDAITVLNRANFIAPTDPAPLTALGEVQAQRKEYDAAAQNYADALRLTKASGLFGAKTVLYQALAQTQLAGGDPKAAQQTLNRAQLDEPASANVWNRLRGEVLLSTGDQTGAEKAFRDAIDAQTDAGTFPQETLALLAAKKLLGTMAAVYRADFGASGAGFSTDATKPNIADVTGRGRSEPPTLETRIRAFAALAAIAQYQGDAAQETAHREAVCRLRGRGSDYYALADAYDGRARDLARAKDAYRKARNIGGLNDAQTARARLRASQIGAAANP